MSVVRDRIKYYIDAPEISIDKAVMEKTSSATAVLMKIDGVIWVPGLQYMTIWKDQDGNVSSSFTTCVDSQKFGLE